MNRLIQLLLLRPRALLVAILTTGMMVRSAPADEKPAKYVAEAIDPVEQVAAFIGGREQTITGRILAEAANDDLLVQSQDGILWMLEGGEVHSRKRIDSPFVPITKEEMADRLLAELPAGFHVHTTPHYVVCYDTSRAYAQWTSSLLERLYKAFTNYWENVRQPTGKGVEFANGVPKRNRQDRATRLWAFEAA